MVAANLYRVNAIYSSIQGEGVLAGTPMTVVRLQGCGVGCPFCDTKETWLTDAGQVDVSAMSWDTISSAWCYMLGEEVAARVRPDSWVLLTGGEPAEQPLHDLVDALHARGNRVEIETSGTAVGLLGADIDWVCVSPKPNMPGGRSIERSVIDVANELKFLVGGPGSIDAIKRFLALYDLDGRPDGPIISVQPISQGERATQLAIAGAIENNWRLSIQLHKYIQVR